MPHPRNKYYRRNQDILCAPMLSKEEVQYLREARRKSGLSWRDVIYQGLGVRRFKAEPKVRKVDDLIARASSEVYDYTRDGLI